MKLAAGAVLAFKATAYGLGCDAPGPHTKAGTTPVAGHTIAADPRVLPLGSIVKIDGLGVRQVHDVGGGVKGRHVDVFMDSCAAARRWGVQRRVVTVVHVPAATAQAPRRVPGHPGAGRLSLDRSQTLLAAGRGEGEARLLVSQTSGPGRVAPAARSLGGSGGSMRADTCGPERGGALRGCSPQAVDRGTDPRETWPLAWLLIGLMVAGALGQLVVIFALLFHNDAQGVTR